MHDGRRSWPTAGIVFGTCALVFVALAAGRATRDSTPHRRPNVLGTLIPNVDVRTVNGSPTRLRDLLAGRPALIYISTPAECASCSNLPLEFQIVRRDTPTIQPILVGSGSSAAEFTPILKRMGIGAAAVIDQRRELLHALGVDSEPLVLLTDSVGRIVFVDWRSTSQAAQYPMGTILHDLSGIVTKK